MSRPPSERLDVTSLRTVPLASRRHLVHASEFGDPSCHSGLGAFVRALPDLLAARALKQLLAALRRARDGRRTVIWALGGHVIKSGVSPFVVALMKQGYVTHLALNGACLIHDFELAYCGETSEDVAESIADGSFGMARETGEILGRVMSSPAGMKVGLGGCVARFLAESSYPHRELSLLAQAHACGVSSSVHVALGTDVVHYHSACNWGAVGRAARRDFDLFVAAVRDLDGGGVYLNVGSAVLLPEVFLKAVSVVRNLGCPLDRFTTVVLDMLDNYRPRENVLVRPGGEGLRILGHHEIIIPLISGALLDDPAGQT